MMDVAPTFLQLVIKNLLAAKEEPGKKNKQNNNHRNLPRPGAHVVGK